ncbi:molybdopterin-dependent oxidoreductase [Actinomycetospora sp. NBRC 106378]|uniref:molybdopterin-containing oxidoreductase family protein n=1 Tax=Actinomycetospora sp. NBRC 106378 TaxID=3032208 RepID=UPI0024A20A1D|nr:molybdopterin-dependent oxidoreductase [Actinomycetospora sp. NBRC 106378]GLZ51984.1 formate dehydrogenase [Actinomycetospora sp. NBRC 106378]
MSAPPRSVRTFCRICEVHCGLVVDVVDEQVVKVRPDREHPVSQGYCCVKGLGLGALHHDEDRVDTPLKRVDGELVPIGWDQALAEIGARVRGLVDHHGARSVALYQGNPTFFSFAHTTMSAAFVEALGSPNVFASHSVDVNTKFHVSTEMYGLSLVHPVPDLSHVEMFVCLGTNPLVSQMSVITVADAAGVLQRISERGGRVVIVDPRRTETARRVGEHLPIRPGTDAYLLAAMLHVLAHEDDLDLARARRVARGVDEFVAAAAPWTPERAAAVTGIPAATIRELARAYAAADGAALYCSTGVNMGPFGSIAYWLIQGLNLLTGNLDRRGGLLVPRGAVDTVRLAGLIGLGRFDEHRTTDGRWHRVAGAFPVGALAGEITTDHPDRVRALFVTAGNPVHSVPGGELRDALPQLDLLVSVDLYRNETAAHADYVLPATDMLERSDFPASHQSLQVVPHAQWTPPVVAPLGERRTEWRIFSDLALAAGVRPWGTTAAHVLPWLDRLLARLPGRLRGRLRVGPDQVVALLLRWGRRTTLAELRRHPEGVLLPATEPGSFLGRRVATPDGLVDLAPADLLADLARLEAAEADLARPGVLRLVGRRDRRSHNSWMHNNSHIRQPDGNSALLHPDDGAARGLDDGDLVEVSSPTGRITLPVSLTTDVAPGVVVVPHGWGHAATGPRRARALPGVNVNDVIPGGPAHLDPVSGQAVMLAHEVTVERASPSPA